MHARAACNAPTQDQKVQKGGSSPKPLGKSHPGPIIPHVYMYVSISRYVLVYMFLYALYMYVCMYVCTYVCMYVCTIYVCMYVCMYVCIVTLTAFPYLTLHRQPIPITRLVAVLC